MRLQKDDVSLSISDTGATVTRFQIGEQHIFFQQQNVLNAAGVLKDRGGMFIGAPVFGKTPQSLQAGLQQHGTIRRMQAAERHGSEPPDSDSPTGGFRFLTHRPDQSWPVLNEQYPFEWGLDVEITLLERGFRHYMAAWRLSSESANMVFDTPMPFNAGLHPYFPAPGYAMIGGELVEFQHMDASRQIEVPADGKVRIHLEPDIGTVLMTLRGYQWLNLWSDHGKRYFCVEPLWDHPRTWGTETGKLLPGNQQEEVELLCSFEFEQAQ